MTQTVVVGRPPIFDEARAVFGPLVERAIFSWGTTVYNLSGHPIPYWLVAHEAVHGQRQAADVEGWWRRYLADREFRLREEIPAHQAEYKTIADTMGRPQRRAHLAEIAKRLSGPLYGRLVTVNRAKALILEG